MHRTSDAPLEVVKDRVKSRPVKARGPGAGGLGRAQGKFVLIPDQELRIFTKDRLGIGRNNECRIGHWDFEMNVGFLSVHNMGEASARRNSK